MSARNLRIAFWISTGLLFLFEGVLPALTFNSDMARDGIQHLGYPAYFGPALALFKVLGALTLILPMVSPRIKEWAYAGFAFNFLFAAISHTAVDGFGGQSVFPMVVLGILSCSYICYHRLIGADTRQASMLSSAI